MTDSIIVWFRQDLRIQDNPALRTAISESRKVTPVFIWESEEQGDWPLGAASRWWLHHSLKSLQSELLSLNLNLVIRKGSSGLHLADLVSETRASSIFWNHRYEPSAVLRDVEIERSLVDKGVDVKTFNSALLFDPDTIRTKQGKPYQVFTPFWKKCLSEKEPAEPLPSPEKSIENERKLRSASLESLKLLSEGNRMKSFHQKWKPGSAGATPKLSTFLNRSIESYAEDRNRPALEGTSLLSPHIHFGEISPREIWHAVKQSKLQSKPSVEGKLRKSDREMFLSELGWREFAYHILYHFPKSTSKPLRSRFEKFPWENNRIALKEWQQGCTGYPIVDAGMRELQATGWMHNRVRMIVGSFLTKDLQLDWQSGARWFWDTLVDADLANNSLGWQWIAGCGADAAPYFRIFNPVTQSERFDPSGLYIKKWLPCLEKLSPQWVHRPWKAPVSTLYEAGITLGETYPHPIVNHNEARLQALEKLASID